MKYSVQKKDKGTVISLSEDLTEGNNDLREDLHNIMDGGEKLIVLDLKKVGYVNASGLGTLISILTLTEKRGGRLRIARASDKLNSLLVITKLTQIFEKFPSVEEALTSA